ncbi:hypothetical protein THRCLA_06794 [Thraustotheca clavata]|uniref:MSP domain-containing protein n=1 Tax=Thraustotheca clavata TaxID=74557 RepID=A0A1V9ZJA4_9STRA|nr:hypothetical protein THRCLA_06794 [Thraustotheca clavata]
MGTTASTEHGPASHGLVVEPEDSIRFDLTPGAAPQVSVTLKNTCNNHNIAYKLKTSFADRYLIRPNHGVLVPRARTRVVIVLQPSHCEDLLSWTDADLKEVADKLCIRWVRTKMTAPETLVEEEFRSMWKLVEKEHIHTIKLRCAFTHDENMASNRIVNFVLQPETPAEATLVISNPNPTQYMAFKVKTTQPMRYRVRPNQGIIRPGHTTSVLLVVEDKDHEDLVYMEESSRLMINDKFMIQSTPVNDTVYVQVTSKGPLDGNDVLDTFWLTVEKRAIRNQKVTGRFLQDKDVETTTFVQLPSTAP